MLTVGDLEALERQVCQALEAGQRGELRSLLADHHPADIADVIDRLPPDDRLAVFRILEPALAADVLGETGIEATRALIRQLPPDEAGDLLDRMPMDDVAEILGVDIPERQADLLAAMEPADADEVRTLLRYPPQSAGRLMTEKFVRVRPDMSAGAVIDYLRQIDPEVETISDLYVLDRRGLLRGVVSLRAVIVAPPGRALAEIMHAEPVTVTPETDQEEVARLVSQYNLSALPVVAESGRMLGIITVDDVIDVLVEESTEDVLRLGAVEGGRADETYFGVPIWRAVRRRVSWLLLLFLTGSVTINVLSYFETALGEVVALSFFIPLLIGTGGNTGAQTVSTMIRGMALGEIRLSDAFRVVGRELASGALLGALLGAVSLALVVLVGNPLPIALVVAFSVVAICTWANTIGAVVPLVAQRFRLDPALVSSPMISTLVDATGLAIYMLIARVILGL